MPLYTFYPCHEDGGADTFQTFDLPNDDAAYERAVTVLQDHISCEYVAVWCGERMLGNTRKRAQCDGSTSLPSEPPPG